MLSATVGACAGSSDSASDIADGDIRVTPDTIFCPDAMILAVGDSIVELSATGTSRAIIPVNTSPSRRSILLTIDNPLISSLFNYGDAPRLSEPAFARTAPRVGNRHPYPLTAYDTDTVFALWNDWLTTGDTRKARQSVALAQRYLDRAWIDRFDPAMKLFRGETATEAVNDRALGMHVDEIAANFSLAANLGYLRMFDIIDSFNATGPSPRRDSLARTINDRFWLPVQSTYGRIIYGAPSRLVLEESSLEGCASAILSGTASAPMAAAMLRKSVSRLDSLFDIASARTVANFGIAACRSGNGTVAWRSLRNLLLRAYILGELSTADTTPFRDLIINGIFGISFTPEGLTFAPMMPEQLAETATLQNVPYRDARLDIEIIGHGDVIATFAIDGVPADTPVVPTTIQGKHTVTITLVGASQSPSTGTTPVRMYPLSASRDSARLYVNSEYMGWVMPTSFSADSFTTPMWYNLIYDPAEGLTPRSTTTHIVACAADSVSFKVADIARPGARTLLDKELSKKYAESTRYKNREITLDYDAPADGRYLLQISYFNGLGTVNPMRNYALRTLSVNASAPTLIVFPQLELSDWTEDTDWQTLRGLTIPEEITLRKGHNSIVIRYYAPADENFDHDANTLIPDRIIIYNLNKQ